ncbi:MAG TPA: class I SAM-dependent methyltransferase [Polyangia bacterium]|jgi:SAM-dependent methyltransferase|nr:class I SAM-dependent methyltransferase [Polyangia bacterium]
MRIREPWPVARSKQRRREFDAVFAGVPPRGLGAALEIGAGDGFLASLLQDRCRSLVTTDLYRPRLAEGQTLSRRLLCDATRLPFRDHAFDFIFSSSLLEHIRNRHDALAEMRRCLRPSGVMVHIMPSRVWKLLQLLFYYPHLLIGGVDLALDAVMGRRRRRRLAGSTPAGPTLQKTSADRWSDARWRPSLRVVLRGILPTVHGEYSGHVAELIGFGAARWVAEFRAAGFTVQGVVPLPLYSGYGFGLERLRRVGERAGLSAHNALVVTPAPDKGPAVDWFVRSPQPAFASIAPVE